MAQLKNKGFVPTAFSKKQKVVLTWWCENSKYKDKDGIICDGSIRSGKTTVMSLSFILWAMSTFDGENFAMCGKTINSLRRNVLKQLKQMLKALGIICEEHRSENYITIRMGLVENDFYLFGGKDEASQDLIQGITLAGVFFDEVALMPESFVNQPNEIKNNMDEYQECLEQIEKFREERVQLEKEIESVRAKIQQLKQENAQVDISQLLCEISSREEQDEILGAKMHELTIKRNLLED